MGWSANDELEWMQKEAVMAEFELLSWPFCEDLVKAYENPQSW
jgi:hypothetical protein